MWADEEDKQKEEEKKKEKQDAQERGKSKDNNGPILASTACMMFGVEAHPPAVKDARPGGRGVRGVCEKQKGGGKWSVVDSEPDRLAQQREHQGHVWQADPVGSATRGRHGGSGIRDADQVWMGRGCVSEYGTGNGGVRAKVWVWHQAEPKTGRGGPSLVTVGLGPVSCLAVSLFDSGHHCLTLFLRPHPGGPLSSESGIGRGRAWVPMKEEREGGRGFPRGLDTRNTTHHTLALSAVGSFAKQQWQRPDFLVCFVAGADDGAELTGRKTGRAARQGETKWTGEATQEAPGAPGFVFSCHA